MAPFAVEISSERQTLNGETSWIEELEEGWYLQRRLDREGEEKNLSLIHILTEKGEMTVYGRKH